MKRILVQAGHKPPLQPGIPGTGAPGEAPLMAEIQQAVVRVLEHDGRFKAIAVPGEIPGGLQVDAALFLHADGVDNTSVRGFCFGYPTGSKDTEVNRDLAELIAAEFNKLPGHPPRRADNPTADAHYYYGFRIVETPGPEVLIEHGFVTNPTEHAWLKSHVEQIAQAEHAALCRYFGFDGQKITPQATLISPPRAPRQNAETYLLARPHGQYTEADVRNIVGYYYSVATAGGVGLDPLLAIAQMILETAHLTSYWSQRPRRNPAGIGVTGAPGAGVSFPSWFAAVQAHVGRLLAYSLPKGKEAAAQATLINKALAARPLPDALRGRAPRLQGLAGTWAKDPQYANKICAIANDILS